MKFSTSLIAAAVIALVEAKKSNGITMVKVALGDPEMLCEYGQCGDYCCVDPYGDEVEPDTEQLDGTETP